MPQYYVVLPAWGLLQVDYGTISAQEMSANKVFDPREPLRGFAANAPHMQALRALGTCGLSASPVENRCLLYATILAIAAQSADDPEVGSSDDPEQLQGDVAQKYKKQMVQYLVQKYIPRLQEVRLGCKPCVLVVCFKQVSLHAQDGRCWDGLTRPHFALPAAGRQWL
jgi:hypothetical protein